MVANPTEVGVTLYKYGKLTKEEAIRATPLSKEEFEATI